MTHKDYTDKRLIVFYVQYENLKDEQKYSSRSKNDADVRKLYTHDILPDVNLEDVMEAYTQFGTVLSLILKPDTKRKV